MAGYMTTLISKIEWLKIALIFKIEVDCIKISFRSQSPEINGAELAGQLWEDPVERVKKVVEIVKDTLW
jgi:hypothetical protein